MTGHLPSMASGPTPAQKNAGRCQKWQGFGKGKNLCWWHKPLISALWRLGPEDHGYEVSLGYIMKLF